MVKITLLVGDLSAKLIIGTPLVLTTQQLPYSTVYLSTLTFNSGVYLPHFSSRLELAKIIHDMQVNMLAAAIVDTICYTNFRMYFKEIN